MTTLWEAPAAVAVFIAWLLAPPQTIGQVADREGIRRELVGPSTGQYSNADLAPRAAPSVGEATTRRPVADAAAVTPPRDEQWWRGRMTALRAALDRDLYLADEAALRIGALTREIVNQTDAAQQDRLRAQLQKSMGELDRLQKLVLADRREIDAVQEDARRLRIPPAWLK